MSTGLRFTLEVDGLPPDAFAVVSFHLTQSLSSLFSLDLSLVSQQFLSLEFAQVLDKMAYLTVWQGDDVQRRVKGVVTWFELGENDKNQMLYSMKVWQHETTHAYNEQGLANRVTPDSLPPVEWLTYGSGYLAGMKLGDTPLLEYTRDRMHRETVRSFGSMAGSNAAYKLTSTYTPAGQLQSQHLNSLVYDRDYGWNDNGDLVRISGPRQTREYGYSATGRLESVRTLAPDLDIRIPYATDPAGNRLPDPELHPDSTLTAWPDNRIAEDAHYVYHYDEYGRLTEKTDLIPAGVKRSTIAYDKRGRPVSVTEGGLTRSMGYDAAGRITVLTNENGSQSTFRYDPVDRLTEQRGFDGRTQRYHYDLTGKLTQSEDEGLITLWHYDASDRITHRTVNGDPAEQWQYDEHGWLTTLSHTCEGHRVSVHYGYDDKGRLTGERQTVENPETGEMLWEHETGHAYSEQGLATRQEPDGLPPVEWLTYGSGYLAGMKLGGTPLVEYTRDRLHRETARSFGGAGSTAGYEQATAYTLTGQLQSRHLNLPQLDCDYTWNDNGQLVRISGPQECREYRYSGTGRLTGVHTTAANLDIDIPYATDPAGNRLPDPELHPDSTLTAWPDNRIAEDAHYVYRYDEYGRLAEKTDRIPEGVIRMHDERTHHYHYDSQHRLVFYTRIQHGEPQVESRYLYDPLGRRTGKRVWRRERDLTGWMSLSRKPEETWYGWDGDRLTTVQTQQTRIQTVYQPGSFTPLLRIETENGEQAKARHRSLAEVLQEDTGVTLPAELAVMLGRLERELRQGSVSEESQQWLAQCGLTAEQMAAQLEAEYIPERKLHLYHCDHRGLPLALISPEGETAWQGEYDEWGNLLGEESAQHLQQSLRLPGQQYDEESGLYYNRNRYYDPLQGRYITQDPIGLRGEWNLYKYPLNPVRFIDSLGLKFHVNGDPSDFNQAVEYLKQDSQMKETIDFLSSSEETINIEYIEGTNVRFNSNNMAIYWNSRASLFCSTELNSKSQSPALGLGHEFAHAQYYLLDKENFMALLSRTDKKYENKEEARVITIIESRAAKTLGECTRGAHSGLPFYRVDGPLQTMKITGTPE
ncbi:RHS repeat-associated core domain-containing protein [Escherichia coli]